MTKLVILLAVLAFWPIEARSQAPGTESGLVSKINDLEQSLKEQHQKILADQAELAQMRDTIDQRLNQLVERINAQFALLRVTSQNQPTDTSVDVRNGVGNVVNCPAGSYVEHVQLKSNIGGSAGIPFGTISLFVRCSVVPNLKIQPVDSTK